MMRVVSQESCFIESIVVDGGIAKQVHLVIKQTPFHIILEVCPSSPVSFKTGLLVTNLVFDNETKEQVTTIDGSPVLKFVARPSKDGMRCDVEMRLLVLSTQYRGLNFILRFELSDPKRKHPTFTCESEAICPVSKLQQIRSRQRQARGEPKEQGSRKRARAEDLLETLERILSLQANHSKLISDLRGTITEAIPIVKKIKVGPNGGETYVGGSGDSLAIGGSGGGSGTGIGLRGRGKAQSTNAVATAASSSTANTSNIASSLMNMGAGSMHGVSSGHHGLTLSTGVTGGEHVVEAMSEMEMALGILNEIFIHTGATQFADELRSILYNCSDIQRENYQAIGILLCEDRRQSMLASGGMSSMGLGGVRDTVGPTSSVVDTNYTLAGNEFFYNDEDDNPPGSAFYESSYKTHGLTM